MLRVGLLPDEPRSPERRQARTPRQTDRCACTAAPAVLRRYAGAPWRVKSYIAIRRALCPFDKVASHTPTRGRIVDLGCGLGFFSMLLAESAPQREVIGLDWDAGRVALLNRLAAGLSNLTFQCVDLADASWWRQQAAGSVDAFTMLDVLYLLPYDEQQRLFTEMRRVLTPTGVVLLKHIRSFPRWKWRWYRWQEHVAVRLVGLTRGRGLWFEQEDISAWLGPRWSSVTVDLSRGYAYPHCLSVLTPREKSSRDTHIMGEQIAH